MYARTSMKSVLLRYMKVCTTFSGLPWNVMRGSCCVEFLGEGWYKASLFPINICRPIFLEALEKGI